MSERKCYGFYISTNEALHRREEIVHDVNKLKGFLGICPQFFGQIFIIDTKENRDKGYEIFKEIYQSVKKCKREILVDEKYLTGQQSSFEDVDPVFQELLDEIEEKAEEKAVEAFRIREKALMNDVRKIKAELDKEINENDNLRFQIKSLKEKNEMINKIHSKEMQKITKEIKALEAEMKRMERENFETKK